MKHSLLNTFSMTLLGTAMLCGCASNAQKSQSSVTKSQVPRDPAIDAYVGAMRADLSSGKVRTINSIMKLSNDEAKVFWPIYEEYESELFDIGDLRVDLIRQFAAAQKGGKLEPDKASELADGYFKFEQQQLDLQKKYYGVIAKELSPVRAAQFAQIEHRVGTIVDLSIAAELPLIQTSSPAVTVRDVFQN